MGSRKPSVIEKMKYFVVWAAIIGIAYGQGGFLANLFGGGNRRPPPQRRPQFRPQPQPRPQPQFQQGFQPRPNPQPQQVRQQQPQPQFNQATRPPTRVVLQPEPQTVNLQPAAAPAPSSAFNCPLNTPNFNWQGQGFIVTFFDSSDGCNKFTGQEADEFCKSVGGRAVSLDSNEKALAIMDLLRQRAQRYMWTGGRIDHNIGVVTWPSGAREGYNRGQRFWSHTGGKKPEPEPQPDNRDGNEICIGVLNNFYADGIKWHDVSCHHKKPTVCQLN